MIKHKLIKEMASQFNSGNVAFIHTETDEEQADTCIAGDMESLIWSVGAIINRIAEIMNVDFMTILMNVNERHKNGRIKNSDATVVRIKGSDWREEWKAKERLEMGKEYQTRTRELEAEKRELKQEVVKLNMKVTELNRRLKETVADREAMILLQTKEIKELEHRIDELLEIKGFEKT